MTVRLAYSTSTPPVEHLQAVELAHDMYGRYWSKPMPESQIDDFIKHAEASGYWLSDIDCTFFCRHKDHAKDEQAQRWLVEAKARLKDKKRAAGVPGYSRKGFCKTHSIHHCTICC